MAYDVKQLGEELIAIAKKELESGGNVTAVMAFYKRGEKATVIPIPNEMMDDRMKDKLSFVMRHTAQAFHADFFLFLSDVYVAATEELSKEEFVARRKAFGSVSKMPEKEDALMLCIESKTTQSMTTIRYKKTDGKVVYQPELLIEGEGTGTEGRFSNILYSPHTKS